MKNAIFIWVLVAINDCHGSNNIIFNSDQIFETGDPCVSVLNGVTSNGVCMPIEQCPPLVAQVLNWQSVITSVCGYENKSQIACCPTKVQHEEMPRQVEPLNLRKNLNCVVANSNEMGVIKFLVDCPELNGHDTSVHINKLCLDDICSDLVCCPIKLQRRLKNVCWNVDHPVDRLRLRLSLNQECTIKYLNMNGRYQEKWSCAFAERNPDLLPSLKKVCNDEDICDGFYCCPIEENDYFGCTATKIWRSTATLIGPKCVDSNTGLKGTCKQIVNCAHPDVASLDKCGTYCCTDYICCPDGLLGPASQTISSRECNSYTKYLSKEEIEVPMNLYINRSRCFAGGAAGGVIANPGEFPHMAALGYMSMDKMLWNCGGSLISNRYVLTAGHCINDRNIGPVRKVRLGVIDLLNDIETYDCPEDYDVANLIPHPDYNPNLVYNDIGLIQLDGDVKFNFHIRPICLPSNSNVAKQYTSMGWGATGTAEKSSVKLIKVNQEYFSYEECAIQYGMNRRFPNGITNDTHICAGSRDSIQSTCPGDSGGPLIVRHSTHDSLFVIQGIVSIGSPCGFANSPGVYTNVYPYIEWIEKIVWLN